MLENVKKNTINKSDRLSSLSIVIDDFDSKKNISKECNILPGVSIKSPQKPYSRQSSDASIKKMLEEAEQRKNQFYKLIDEHNAVIENLKRIEQLENSNCEIP